jgi:hypothetical protein
VLQIRRRIHGRDRPKAWPEQSPCPAGAIHTWFEPTGARVKNTESEGFSGCDAGKRIKGRKRHIVTDTTGFLVGLEVHGAGIQDRHGAPNVLKAVGARYSTLRHIFADGG